VTVTATLTAGTLSGNQNLCVGSTDTYASTVTGGTWSSSNTAVATVNATTGLVTALTAGTATITYTVTGTGGCPNATATRTVTVTATLTAGTLSGNQNLCVGSTDTYTSTVTGGTWSSSNTAVATVNATTGLVTALTAGTATITYTVLGTGGCSNGVASIVLTVNSIPNLVLGTVSPVCQPNTIDLTSSSIILGSDSGLIFSYWTNLNATTALNNPNAVAQSGVYYIRGLNPITGCSTIQPISVIVRPIDTVVVDTAICSPTILTIGTQQFAASGNYQVRFTNTFGCDSMVFIRLTVYNNPVAFINPLGATAFCSGDSVVLRSNIGGGLTFQWLLNGNIVPGATSNTLTARDSGQYQVIVSFGNTCLDTSAILSVTVNPRPNAVISQSGSVSLCTGNTIIVSAATVPNANYTWYRNGFPIPNSNTTNISINSAGFYYFKVATSICEDFSDTLVVTVAPRPISSITANGPTNFCQGGSVTLNAAQFPGATVAWLLNGAPIAGATSFSFLATQSGAYRAVLTLGSCTDTSGSISLNVFPAPLASITVIGDTSFCEGQFVQLSAPQVSGISYIWLNNGNPVLGQYGRVLTVRNSGVYQVVMINPLGCADTSSAQVTIMRPRPAAPVITINSTRDTLVSSIANGNQWYYNGFPIFGATGQSLPVTANGFYFSIVTGANGCPSDTSNIINLTNVGLGDEQAFNLQLYPNPTSGEAWIEFDLAGVLDMSIEITNAAGAVVREYEFNRVQSGTKYKLDLMDLAEGVYFANIRSNEAFMSKKLLIAR